MGWRFFASSDHLRQVLGQVWIGERDERRTLNLPGKEPGPNPADRGESGEIENPVKGHGLRVSSFDPPVDIYKAKREHEEGNDGEAMPASFCFTSEKEQEWQRELEQDEQQREVLPAATQAAHIPRC